MKKVFAVLITVVLFLLLSVSCSSDGSVDEAFNCTITFNGNGADSEGQAHQRVSKGIGIDLKDNTFIKDGFGFLWWNTEADGSGTDYFNGQHVCFDEDLTLYAQWGILISEDTTALTDGNRYTLDRNVEIAERVTVTGNVILILPDGYRLTAQKGISVNEGNSLTIQALGVGTGELTATAADSNCFDAAIGGDDNCSSGIITINSGIINATGNIYGAGIGGGEKGAGTVIINGGTVTATSGIFGAAIGGGDEGTGSVTINSGMVTANSSQSGAGIGGGYKQSGTVIINGGTVTATSQIYGAAIGGGDVGNGVVTISCGTVIATSAFSGAGIGGGFKGNGTVIINGGTVTASCLDCGAGIGVGYTGSGGSVTINGGTVTATNGYFGSGIGGGYVDSGIDVTINGGQVFAAGGDCEDYFEIKAVGIGRGGFGADDGTLTLGEGVALEVSSDNENWSDYDGTTRQQYMRTK